MILGCTKRIFAFKKKEAVDLLYSALARKYLGVFYPLCFIPIFWDVYLRKDISKLERKPTRMEEGFESMSFVDWLKKLHMFSLEEKRVEGM